MGESETEWPAIFDLAVRLAKEAGAELRQRFDQQRTVTFKSDLDPVTDADYAAETLIREGIMAAYPTHTILAEESGLHEQNTAIRWIIDPLDGTVNYAHGFPIYAVSIGVADADGGRLGVIYDPSRDELFTVQRGEPSRLNNEPIRVSDTAELKRGLLATGFPYDRHLKTDNNHREHIALNLASQGVRRAGSAALDLAYVACGRFDGYWEQGLSPWDVAAGSLLVTNAGGRVSTYSGAPHDGFGPQVVASNGHLHDAMLSPQKRHLLSPTQVFTLLYGLSSTPFSRRAPLDW